MINTVQFLFVRDFLINSANLRLVNYLSYGFVDAAQSARRVYACLHACIYRYTQHKDREDLLCASESPRRCPRAYIEMSWNNRSIGLRSTNACCPHKIVIMRLGRGEPVVPLPPITVHSDNVQLCYTNRALKLLSFIFLPVKFELCFLLLITTNYCYIKIFVFFL